MAVSQRIYDAAPPARAVIPYPAGLSARLPPQRRNFSPEAHLAAQTTANRCPPAHGAARSNRSAIGGVRLVTARASSALSYSCAPVQSLPLICPSRPTADAAEQGRCVPTLHLGAGTRTDRSIAGGFCLAAVEVANKFTSEQRLVRQRLAFSGGDQHHSGCAIDRSV